MPSKNEKDLLDALKPQDAEPSEAGKQKKSVMPMTPSAMKKMMGGQGTGKKK